MIVFVRSASDRWRREGECFPFPSSSLVLRRPPILRPLCPLVDFGIFVFFGPSLFGDHSQPVDLTPRLPHPSPHHLRVLTCHLTEASDGGVEQQKEKVSVCAVRHLITSSNLWCNATPPLGGEHRWALWAHESRMLLSIFNAPNSLWYFF